MYKKIIKMMLVLFLVLTLTSCNNNNTDKPLIVTTLFPQYDMAKNIVGDKFDVVLLPNPGSEIHDFEPTSRQISSIKKSDLFIFSSYEIDSWLNNNAYRVSGDKTVVLNLSTYLDLEHEEEFDHDEHEHDEHEHDEHEHEHKHDHNHDHGDLHYWTDTTVYLELLEVVSNRIAEIDYNNKDYYLLNAKNYSEKILTLHNSFLDFLNKTENKKIYFSGHNALDSFSKLYNIKITALVDSIKPDADITSVQMIRLINEIKENNINYLFTEELSDPKVSQTIKNELKKKNQDVTLLELHGYHNISKEDNKNNITFYDLLSRNVNNLKEALKWI